MAERVVFGEFGIFWGRLELCLAFELFDDVAKLVFQGAVSEHDQATGQVSRTQQVVPPVCCQLAGRLLHRRQGASCFDSSLVPVAACELCGGLVIFFGTSRVRSGVQAFVYVAKLIVEAESEHDHLRSCRPFASSLAMWAFCVYRHLSVCEWRKCFLHAKSESRVCAQPLIAVFIGQQGLANRANLVTVFSGS